MGIYNCIKLLCKLHLYSSVSVSNIVSLMNNSVEIWTLTFYFFMWIILFNHSLCVQLSLV